MPQALDRPHILFVNPWIHDFAAYDFWAKPLGLLSLAGILRHNGFNVSYVDCLDRFHRKFPKKDPFLRSGRGPYLKTQITKPHKLADIERTYSRYGIRRKWFRKDLSEIERPDLILVTSFMTYWYPGVHETIGVLKAHFPKVPLILGGTYASLCKTHAETTSAADHIFTGMGAHRIVKFISDLTGFSPDGGTSDESPDKRPFPAFDLQSAMGYIPLLTASGCPFSCSYCASHWLAPKREARSPEAVFREIKYWHYKYGIRDFVFYDDALLINAKTHILPLLELIITSRMPLRFHTPNALHIREITPQVARHMHKAGFKTIRLGLETAIFDNRADLDQKVTEREFKKGIDNLKKVGFGPDEVGAYLLMGLPGQKTAAVKQSIQIVKKCGITPILAHYSPIPHTALWPRAVAISRYDLESDPIFSNNAIMPCRPSFSWKTLSKLKALIGK